MQLEMIRSQFKINYTTGNKRGLDGISSRDYYLIRGVDKRAIKVVIMPGQNMKHLESSNRLEAFLLTVAEAAKKRGWKTIFVTLSSALGYCAKGYNHFQLVQMSKHQYRQFEEMKISDSWMDASFHD